MKNTTVISHLNEEIKTGNNLIYCSTMQLAWNELCDYFKGDILFRSNAEAMKAASELNKKSFNKTDLNQNSFIALADLVGNDIISKIAKELKERFNETSKCDFSQLEPDDVLAYAFLLKVLEFEHKFENIENFQFSGGFKKPTSIEAFGIKKAKINDVSEQVKILYWNGPSDFVIDLKTKSGEFITLAKMKPEETLQKTYEKVVNNISKSHTDYLRKDEILKIPKISFDLEHHFNEMVGQDIYISKDNNPEHSGYYVGDAVQFIKFDLNEEGAKLRSEAAILCYRCKSFQANTPREFIFDSPFMICLKQTKDAAPYFVSWVENTEILKEVK
jgi:hypothetical protein